MAYRLSRKAEEDILDIYLTGAGEFGTGMRIGRASIQPTASRPPSPHGDREMRPGRGFAASRGSPLKGWEGLRSVRASPG